MAKLVAKGEIKGLLKKTTHYEETLEKVDKAKGERTEKVESIEVTISTGKTFNANEDSQNRMNRAYVGLKDGIENGLLPIDKTITWKLADNTFQEVTHQELLEALILAGELQSGIWKEYK